METVLSQLPKKISKNVTIDGVTFLAGAGKRKTDIMFVTPVVSEEEAAEVQYVGYGNTISRTPRMLDSPQGVMLKDIALREGIDMDKCFTVPIVRYLPEKKYRIKPSVTMMNSFMPFLEEDIKDIKPKIIVCLGKLAFTQVVTLKTPSGKKFSATESDIMGNWFYEARYNARVYYMPAVISTLNPEKHDRFALDFAAVKSMHDAMKGGTVEIDKPDYRVISNSKELQEFVLFLMQNNFTELAVDCEWHGCQHVDGKLRSLQITWAPGTSAYIRFMDDKLNYAFDVPYKEAGEILSAWLDNPDVKYIGHHVSSDLPWMHKWLGLQWHGKAMFDTMFALQCCDESADLGLDVLALKYTNLGKYDWDLIAWRKTHDRSLTEDGYGYIPDEILIPYAQKDTDVTFRAYLAIKPWLEKQGLTEYYNRIVNPLVTDVFTSFCIKGLPVSVEKMNEMRDLYQWCHQELAKDFQEVICKEADELLQLRLKEIVPDKADQIYETANVLLRNDPGNLASTLRNMIGPEHIMELEPVIDHWINAPKFKTTSPEQMKRWLFDVKKYTPIKSTANKDQGMPSIAWDKVLTYPPEKQAQYTPASDKGTIAVLASRYDDNTLNQFLELNACNTICKSFLKPDVIEADGETTKQDGLHYYVTSEGTMALNHSMTDTGKNLLYMVFNYFIMSL